MARVRTAEEAFQPIPEEVKKFLKPRGIGGDLRGKLFISDDDFNLSLHLPPVQPRKRIQTRMKVVV